MSVMRVIIVLFAAVVGVSGCRNPQVQIETGSMKTGELSSLQILAPLRDRSDSYPVLATFTLTEQGHSFTSSVGPVYVPLDGTFNVKIGAWQHRPSPPLECKMTLSVTNGRLQVCATTIVKQDGTNTYRSSRTFVQNKDGVMTGLHTPREEVEKEMRETVLDAVHLDNIALSDAIGWLFKKPTNRCPPLTITLRCPQPAARITLGPATMTYLDVLNEICRQADLKWTVTFADSTENDVWAHMDNWSAMRRIVISPNTESGEQGKSSAPVRNMPGVIRGK